MASSYKRLGRRQYYTESGDVGDVFLALSREDEACAGALCEMGRYNQAVYFLIQAVEKYIKHRICRRINVTNPYYAELLRKTGHSLEQSLTLLIQVEANGDETMEEHMSRQIQEQVLQNVRFSSIYNAVRYPFYHHARKTYAMMQMSRKDYDDVQAMFALLRKYLQELAVRVR